MSAYLEETATAQTRSQIYWWLGGCFLDKPTEAGLATLRNSVAGLVAGGNSPAPVTALAVALAASEGRAEALALAFTHLFRGLGEGYGPPPPFESVYRESRLLGEISVAVMDFYQQAGFGEIVPEAGPQDHISAELRFLALLCHRESAAWQAQDLVAALACLKQQAAFHQRHLSRWVPDWCQRILQASQETFYSALAETLLWFIQEDSTQINEWISALEQAGSDTIAAW